MRPLLPLLSLMVLGCGDPPYKTGSVDLRLSDGDTTETFRVRDVSTITATIGGLGAQWPAVAAYTGEELGTEDYDMLQVEFSPLRVGTRETILSELRMNGQIYNTERTGGLFVITEEVRWTGNRSFPFEHRGTFSGAISYGGGAWTVDEGSFTISGASCTNTIVNDGVAGCGTYFNASGEDMISEVPAEPTGDCPQALWDAYIDGTEMTARERTLFVGDAQPLSCVRTGRKGGDVYKVACGHDQVIEVDGCNWSTLAYGGPGYLTVSAAIVDGSCDYDECRWVVGEP